MINEKYDINSSIPAEEFQLAHDNENIHDTKFETRPVSWFEDSLRRFCKNPASVVGFVVIAVLILFAIIVPIASPFNHFDDIDFKKAGFRDVNYKYCLPKLFDVNDAGFWDGTETISIGGNDYNLKRFSDANSDYILTKNPTYTEEIIGSNVYRTYKVRVDSYAVGVKTFSLEAPDFAKIQEYEASKGITFSLDNPNKSVIKPLIDYETYLNGELRTYLTENHCASSTIDRIVDQMTITYQQNPQVFFKLRPSTKRNGNFSDTQFEPLVIDGKAQEIYLRDASGNLVFYPEVGSTIRVDYNAYFKYKYNLDVKFVFGSNSEGKDLFTRLAQGIGFSLLLGLGITAINFIIGLIWGAISGYYGGVADLVMERVTDIIANVPTVIIMTICSIQFTSNFALKAALGPGGIIILAILVAFVYNGWVGVAGTTRMQFYRFKGQEYVLASRTLGAKDRRLIFKHILPNAAGTLVTSCVLMIPGVIFSESSLSYLGIINLKASNIDSVGVLLQEGQEFIKSTPHILIFPVVLIGLLMISFNLFGNGLRDAFNTTLRGSED